MNQENKIQTEYDEINLMDYAVVVLKRKWLIFGIFLIAVIAAGIFSYFAPKIYEIDTSLEIGKIGETIIEKPLQIVEKINNDVYEISIREKLGIQEGYPKIKAEDIKNTNLVKIKIESDNPGLSKRILEEMNNLILAEHQEKMEKKKVKIEENIKEIQEELTLLETKKQYSEGIAELQIELTNLKNQLVFYKPTKIIKNPTVSDGPIRPRFLLNVIIAGVLGLFMGVFLAFGREWWQKNKERV